VCGRRRCPLDIKTYSTRRIGFATWSTPCKQEGDEDEDEAQEDAREVEEDI